MKLSPLVVSLLLSSLGCCAEVETSPPCPSTANTSKPPSPTLDGGGGSGGGAVANQDGGGGAAPDCVQVGLCASPGSTHAVSEWECPTNPDPAHCLNETGMPGFWCCG